MEEMEMPTPCQKCGEIFDLNDGHNSEKWYPSTVICEQCGRDEEAEMETDEEIRDEKERLENAMFDVKDAIKNLRTNELLFGYDTAILFDEFEKIKKYLILI